MLPVNTRAPLLPLLLLLLSVYGCAEVDPDRPATYLDGASNGGADGHAGTDTGPDAGEVDAGAADTLSPCEGTPRACAKAAEQRAADRLKAVTGDSAKLDAFLKAVPKGGDLHLHLSGSVYAETYWASAAAREFAVKTMVLACSPATSCSAVR